LKCLRIIKYNILIRSLDNAGDKFCEEDIDCILQRRTQVITLETGEKGSTFSKASFASTGIREDINLDDPDFWTKWAKKAEIEMDEMGQKVKVVNEIQNLKQP